MKKWFLALSALALVAMIWLLPTDYDVLAEGVSTVSEGDAGTGSGNTSTENKVQLAAPSNVSWIGWYASWDSVEECEGYYSVYVYKNGEALTKFAVEPDDDVMMDVVAELQAQGIEMEEGASYSVTVTANATANTEIYNTSEQSAMSAAQVWGEVSALPVPKLIGFDEQYMKFYYQATAQGYYRLETLKDGELLTFFRGEKDAKEKNGCYTLPDIDESGVYQCRVRYYDETDPENPIYGEWVTSDEFVYTKPEKKLATTSVAWDMEQAGTANATITEDCNGYEFELWRWDEESGKDKKIASSYSVRFKEAGKEITYTMSSKYLEQQGKYRVRVRQLSSNILNTAHSDWSEFSDYYIVGDAETATVKLAAPENVTWLGWYASWDSVAECEGNYSVYVYKNGEVLTKFDVEPADTELMDVVAELQAQGIAMEEGASYSVAVTANKPANVVNCETSELSAMSAAQVWGEDVGLPVPKLIGMDEKYLAFYYQATAEGYYEGELVREGTTLKFYKGTRASKEKNNFTIIDAIDESGVYQCRVRFVDMADAANPIYGEWCVSDEFVYTKPDKKLATASATWDLEQAGVAKAILTEDCMGYRFDLWGWDEEKGEDVQLISRGRINSHLKAGQEVSYTIPDKYLEQPGKYKIRIRQLSHDFLSTAHGDWGEFSDYYVIGDEEDDAPSGDSAPEQVTNAVEDAMEQAKTDAAGAVDTLVTNTDISDLREALQTDEKIQEQLAELEKLYSEQVPGGITVEKPKMSEEVKDLLPTENIKVVGAAFNAVDGKVNLDVAVPEKKVEVDKKYKDNVQFDIKLMTGGEARHGKLRMPISITLPVPKGINLEYLTILHYFVDGGSEVVKFKDNGDGTVTFTVDQFSTFVFANEAEDVPTPEPTPEPEEDEDEDEDEEEAVVEPVKDNVPKTGDSLPIALPMAATVIFVGAAFAFRKREQ